MKENLLVDLSRPFAVDIIKLYDTVRETKKHTVIINQLLRCGTSIGATYTRAITLQAELTLSTSFRLRLKNATKQNIGLILCAMQRLSLKKHMIIILLNAVK